MTFLSDLLLLSAAVTAAIYCRVLARRLKRLSGAETGVASAIATLSVQAEDLRKAVESARQSSAEHAGLLDRRIRQADAAAARLEVLLAALHEPEDPLRLAHPVRTAR
jgi:ABC-type transporter Mla subunit MlaD